LDADLGTRICVVGNVGCATEEISGQFLLAKVAKSLGGRRPALCEYEQELRQYRYGQGWWDLSLSTPHPLYHPHTDCLGFMVFSTPMSPETFGGNTAAAWLFPMTTHTLTEHLWCKGASNSVVHRLGE
jgi:hypothetical protein